MWLIAVPLRLRAAGRAPQREIAPIRCGLLTGAIAALLLGCTGDQSGAPETGSMFRRRTVSARVVVAGDDQKPVVFPSLALNGSPISVVQKALRVVQDEHDKKMRAFEKDVARIRAELRVVDLKAIDAREAVARDYNDSRPSVDSEQYATRNPLKGLSKARAVKSQADIAYKEAYAVKIKPLEEELARLSQEEWNVQESMALLTAGLADKLFNALPMPPAAQWKTDPDGKQNLEIPQDEPWCIWTQGSHRVATAIVTESVVSPSTGRGRSTSRPGGYRTTIYRWMLVVPDALDASGDLCFDETNVYDGTAASRIAPAAGASSIIQHE